MENGASSAALPPPSGPTPINTAEVSSRRITISTNDSLEYGKPISVSSLGNFPHPGTTMGEYFFVDTIGTGTFSSIYKAIHLKKKRIVAAKIELDVFKTSGVSQAEASVLDFLHQTIPNRVPRYYGHYTSQHDNNERGVIFMEYLPGSDIHKLREGAMIKPCGRRIHLEDAKQLSIAMLDLLAALHHCGVIHRDVKPSNVVRRSNQDFCLVDFGLSKSVIVSADHALADRNHPWGAVVGGGEETNNHQKPWMRPSPDNTTTQTRGCFRMARAKAEFRGTSMYASLKVHELQDYSFRDDMYSLLYVFCDLATGGLPWMSHAANKDRDNCHKVKSIVHANNNGKVNELLYGELYHLGMSQRAKEKQRNVPVEHLSEKPLPLKLASYKENVHHLRKAFEHVAGLQFWDMPDYELLKECIQKIEASPDDPVVPRIDWKALLIKDKEEERPQQSPNYNQTRGAFPEWEMEECSQKNHVDHILSSVTDVHMDPTDFWSCLPLKRRLLLSQLDYNLSERNKNVPVHQALHDWMAVVLWLLYQDWDAKQWEDGGHRTSTDGFKRMRYLELLRKCDSYAKQFHSFQSELALFEPTDASSSGLGKKRKIRVQEPGKETSQSVDGLYLSRVLFGLRRAIQREERKSPPPPSRLMSFS